MQDPGFDGGEGPPPYQFDLTARAQIWIHSSEYPPHGPVQFSACEWYGHLSLLEAFLEAPERCPVEIAEISAGLPRDEWLDAILRFSYEEEPSGIYLEEIRPSSERIEELEKQLRDAGDQMAIQDERNEELRATLEELISFLSGPPPIAIRRALQALGRPEEESADPPPIPWGSLLEAMKRDYKALEDKPHDWGVTQSDCQR